MAISLLHRKESVVLTAIEIIDDLGIQGLSTKELAKRQEISEGTLFKHFKSKNEIILAVLDHFSKFDLDIFESTLARRAESERAIDMIRFWVDAYATYYENYPAITAVAQLYDVFNYDAVLNSKVKDIYGKRLGYLKQIIEDIQHAGEIKATIDARILVDIIIGSFRTICLTWRMEGRNFSLRDRTLSSLDVIVELLKAK
ncbi:TetR/AcrR family transcriptional regulator [Sporomusa malonica]|uniref:Transcriptional regulator, TetR family n=1 Tax=Sporomusa malonica TaxID=112901 RepID=A0A1W2DLH3_9FIRM|nr:TetR/AcrR family transcriptional regulator [Sporomusa malonica]SMC97856.1 transcriptional regulator, TetR family [Sporomusa malonica]